MGCGVASTALISIDTNLSYVYHRFSAHVLAPVGLQHETVVLGLHRAGIVREDLGELIHLGSRGLNGALEH